MTLLLQWVCVRIGSAVNLDALGLNLYALTSTKALNKSTLNSNAGTGSYALEALLCNLLQIDNNLNIGNARAIVKCNEGYILVATLCSYPTLNNNLSVVGG